MLHFFILSGFYLVRPKNLALTLWKTEYKDAASDKRELQIIPSWILNSDLIIHLYEIEIKGYHKYKIHY